MIQNDVPFFLVSVRVWETRSSWAEFCPSKPRRHTMAYFASTEHARRPGFEIDQAGVCHLAYPIVVLDRENKREQAAAKISMSVNLPHRLKART